MATKSTPLYGRITSAQVLEVLKYSSGSDLKTQQAQLTATCNQLEQLSTPSIGLSELLDMEDRDLLKRAAVLLRDLNRHVERAKEVRVELEKREDKARKAYLVAISGLIAKRFPSVTDETPELSNCWRSWSFIWPYSTATTWKTITRGAFVAIRAGF